jgi:hypothetical protein
LAGEGSAGRSIGYDAIQALSLYKFGKWRKKIFSMVPV